MYRNTVIVLMGFFLLMLIAWLIKERYTKPALSLTAPVTSLLASVPVEEVEVIPFVTRSGWGYEIKVKGKPHIRQNTIPALAGNKGFSTREKALLAGKLVAYKMTKGVLPPTISENELDSLQVLH